MNKAIAFANKTKRISRWMNNGVAGIEVDLSDLPQLGANALASDLQKLEGKHKVQYFRKETDYAKGTFEVVADGEGDFEITRTNIARQGSMTLGNRTFHGGVKTVTNIKFKWPKQDGTSGGVGSAKSLVEGALKSVPTVG